MRTPSQAHALCTALALGVSLSLLAVIAASIVYVYRLGLLEMMLHLFPGFEHIGLIGFLLIPILVVLMLIWAAFCVAVTCALLLFLLAVAIALVVLIGELLVNLVAEPWAISDPMAMVVQRLTHIWRGALRAIRVRP